MKIKFWGTRGSIPSPLKPDGLEEKLYQAISNLPDIDRRNPEAVWAYVKGLPPLLRGTAGGNTACVQVQASGETLILDAGSGLRELGLELMQGECGRGEGRLHLFISHLHWDHIQGFPFFLPAYVPGNRIWVYGIHAIQPALQGQQDPHYFPVPLSYLQAELEFVKLGLGQPFAIGQVQVEAMQNAHPGQSYSYRLQDPHSRLVYATDAEYKQLDDASVQPHVNFFGNADALIFDAQYTLREAWQKTDWGHSSALIGVDLARAAGVKTLILFHHDPTYSDQELQEMQTTATAYQAQDTTRPTCEVLVAYEGLALDLTPPGSLGVHLTAGGEAAILTPTRVFDESGVNCLAEELARLTLHSANSIIDLSRIENLTTAGLKALVTLGAARKGEPVVLAAPSQRLQQVIKLAGYEDYFAIYPSVDTALAAVQAREALNLPGQVIEGRYQIECKVGDSHLGAVLRAIDSQTGRVVALKVLSASFSQETLARFLRQARQVTELEHPHIAPVLSWGEEGSRIFLVEELIEGQTLHQRLTQDHTPLSANQIMSIAVEIARALEYAHSRGVVHGDLKPHNVFLTAKGVKLNGFGLGRLEEGRALLDAPWHFLTLAYLAPEQILGQAMDARTDLYALGVMLYQMLTGRLPFQGSERQVMEAHLNQTPRPPRQLNPSVSLSLEHLVLKLLAKNPNERYTSAQQTRRISNSLIVREDATHQRRGPLVGRDELLGALEACWQECRGGRGQLAFITGEPGIGKTSLAQRLAAQCAPPVLLVGHGQEMEGSPAYFLFSQVLHTYFATVPPEFLDEQAHLLISHFIRLAPEVRRMLPDLPEPPALEPQQEQLRLMSSLTRFVERATQQRPWFLILDDLQWADPNSLELLHYLGRHAPTMALFIIGIYRDLELEREHPLLKVLRDLGNGPAYHHFSLGRLGQVEVGQMLANIWEQAAPAALVEKIYQHTGGNPFFVEEVARGLVDEGLLTTQGTQWRFPALEEVRLPPSVQEVVWRRISYLSPDTQALLRQATVLGQIFRFGDLRELSGLSEWQVLEHLDMALERQLVLEVLVHHSTRTPPRQPDNAPTQDVPGDILLRFRHVEIQQVLYEDLGPLRRRVLHRQAGEALERRAQPEPERIAEELAHHFGQAGEFERALAYSPLAAQQAQAAFANESALWWNTQTLKMLDGLGPDRGLASFHALQVSAHRSLGEILTLMSRYDKALAHIETARAILESETPTTNRSHQLAHLYCLTAHVHEERGEYALAVKWLEKGLAHLDENEPSTEAASLYYLWGRVHNLQGNYDAARTTLERAINLAQMVRSRRVEANSLRALGLAFYHQGDCTQSQACYRQAISICIEIGDRQGEGMTTHNLGIVCAEMGEPHRAVELFERTLAIMREIGDRRNEGNSLGSLGMAYTILGQARRAIELFEQSLAIAREIGDRRNEGTNLTNLGLAYARLGELHRAIEFCKQSLVIMRKIGDRRCEGYALTYLGHALVSLEQLPQAAQAYRQALEIRRELGEHHLAMEALAGLAHVSLAQQDLLQAQTEVEEILGYLEHHTLDGADEPFRVYLTCYQVLRAIRDERAESILDVAYHLLQELAAKIEDVALRHSFLENVAAHRELAREFVDSTTQAE